MKKILMFYQKWCPYCRKAFDWIDELKKENPAYAAIQIETVDENADKKRADSFDYYYVPTFYIDGKKVHEGAASKQIIEEVFKQAMDR
ncbi:MAG: thioredoxin family protein [Sphaerochaetaceae bacterium]|nr:thioredoxin family protein [Sphaerochaetaceae bacterium]MDD3164214.1 thioredoxin family protein [Sphaerochaetaceae bacterium]MDD4007387.1 thioredoxin family protein [Sphaerochaetaceae bacterium]MDD4396180.1 thioredoxin family protein [Sphaerochaetaceae bacterium]